jgi:glycosyltransferase involved in cell wall biosynthesis
LAQRLNRIVTQNRLQPSELRGKRIVILIGVFMRGGCERQAFLLARDLRHRNGLDAHVWALKQDGPFRSEFEAAGIPTKVLGWGQPRFGWVQRCLPVVRQLRESRVDILLPFTTWPNVVAGLTYRFAGVRLCIWGQRSSGGERAPGVERLAATQYRRFVANSSGGVEFLVQDMHISSDRISFIPNGVEQPKWSDGREWRERLGLDSNQLLVVKVANLTNYKDHVTLLRAWKIVQEQWSGGPRPMLALAGMQCETYPECLRIVSDADLNSTVRFLGPVLDVPALLDACDLTVFSSPQEGMPNGVMEYMAHGKAVVASDLPGIRDVIGSSVQNVLVPPGNAQRFADGILALLRDAARRDTLGAANRERIKSEFSIEQMADRHLDVILHNLPNAQPGNWHHAKSVRPARPGQALRDR